MTKNEAIEAGRARGRQYAEGWNEDALRAEFDREAHLSTARANAMSDCHLRSVDSTNGQAYVDAFMGAAGSTWSVRRNELPDIKAAQRLRYLRRHIDEVLGTSKAAVERFAERLAKNPFDAFEWGADAVQAAARLSAYTALLGLLDEKGIDAAVEAARTEALRYARFGHHSTSAMANIAAECKAAAFAEFAERDVRW